MPEVHGYFILVKSRVNTGIAAICILELIPRGAPAVWGYIICKVIFHLTNMEMRENYT